MHENQLMDILHNARQHNSAVGITGVLLYSQGTFIQVLEGRDKVIDALYLRITADQRHKNIIKLIEGPIDEKSFPQWLMGFSVTDPEVTAGLVGYLKSIDQLQVNNGHTEAVASIKTFIAANNLKINI